ncbi:hypothetical protein BDY19DRAFT_884720 [Irpex rosettiformis]|uniref:Uncharacterized protein n=1 Tax=Irpex rosettiformis TaxID=378272 RepID=A0ACB8UBX5_9APHY|nr:hypothetical protein BDY19DRAFT_884720 [Irpex rosettiformis]
MAPPHHSSRSHSPVSSTRRDEALTRLLDLSTSTVKHNADLEIRLNELELELSVWKQAHASVLDAAELAKKTHNAQVCTLNRQISSLETLQVATKGQNPVILCIVDGDVNLFHWSLLPLGQQGGLQAAQKLTQGIAEFLSQEDVQVFGRLSFWISVFLNRRTVLDTLLAHAACTAEQFDAFLTGFSQASPRFQIVEVGTAGDGVNSKIKEHLHNFTRFPQTLRVFLAGGRGNTYASTLNSLGQEELLGKLVLLQGSFEPSAELHQLALPSIRVEGLFMSELPPGLARRAGTLPPGPLALPAPSTSVTTNGGLISPQSETHPVASPRVGIPLHKQSPPPCNEHYLMSCSKGVSRCKYSHDWALSLEQLDVLAKNAKKAPCNYLKNGLECPHGDRCCWGHVCPGGARCFHLSKGKCWFKGGESPQ